MSVIGKAVGRELELAVKDTGIGIAESDLPRLFREFEQIEPSSGSKPEGTGLGLALTMRLVEMHGGRLRVDSKVGEGSTFTVTLPLLGGSSPAAAMPASDPLATEPVALVVDDDPGAGELIAGHLRSVGLSVIFARSPDEALRLVGSRMIVGITLDVIMPGGSGWSVLEELKRAPETAKIPVIVCSVVDELNRGVLLGASACLVKPVRADDLARAFGDAGVSLCRLQGTSVLLVKKGDDRGDIEEHLFRAGCQVHRASDVAGADALVDVDVAIVDGVDPTEAGRIASALASKLPGLPILALVDPSARLTGPLPSEVKPMFRGDALRLDRLVRAVWTALQNRKDGASTLRRGSEIIS